MIDNIVPGVRVGIWKVGMAKHDVVQSLSDFVEEHVDGGFRLVARNYMFWFDEYHRLTQIMLMNEASDRFDGIGIGTTVGELRRIYPRLLVDVISEVVVIKDVPGISFNSEDDPWGSMECDWETVDYLEWKDLDILDSRIKYICVFEIKDDPFSDCVDIK